MDIGEIQELVRQGRYEFGVQAQEEGLQDDLDVTEIEEVILRGEILEEYPSDPRGESCLILAYAAQKPVHVVLGWATRGGQGGKTMRIITVYSPRVPKWSDPRTRGGGR